jgi:phosphoribosyl 1,2-cyclic phosphodiesterase
VGDFTITFWGTRGSIPVSGSRYREFGGNTICIEVRIGDRSVIVDCGTGALGLGEALLREQRTSASLLLTHLHLDHIVGLTGFQPLYRDRFSLAIRAARRQDVSLGDGLSTLFGEPLNPIGFDALPARVEAASFEAGDEFAIGDIGVRTIALRHGPGTAGYRFDHDGRAFVVMTDHEHDGDLPDPALVAFCGGADAIAYDAMWCADSDYEAHRGWGHSTWQAGLALARAAEAGRLVCIHHAPGADDALLRDREARMRSVSPRSAFARDGDVLAL